jgi:ubiquinone/menaquinone biosynthesis C-methylase UbiE
MGTPWDRAAAGYLEEWVPRFVPYHLDLIHEMALKEGDRVLVTSAGPGAEVLAAARTIGGRGVVRATDRSAEMVRICRQQIELAQLPATIECAQADAVATAGGPWDAVICAFGLWQLDDRVQAVRAWGRALSAHGKVGVITWGPSDPAEPFERLANCLRQLEPGYSVPTPHVHAARDSMAAMFAEAGLAMVRHTVVRHTLSFASAEAFVRAMREACTWRCIWEELGDARLERVAARFYDEMGGPGAPLSFEPPATIAIAGPPGAEVELENRHSVRVPRD